MANRVHIPQSGDELTPAWFTSSLGSSGGATVSRVEREIVGGGIGFIGELHRCRLTWSDASSGNHLPQSVIVKIPSSSDTNRAVGEALQAYEREIAVYRNLGGRLGLPMPAHHYSEFDKNPGKWLEPGLQFLFEKLPVGAVNWLLMQFIKLSGKSKRRYILVIDDIDDARPPSQVEGGSLEDVNAALDVLARFHAHNWMDEDAVGSSRLLWPVDQAPKVWQASYVRNREQFLRQFGDIVDAEKMAKLDATQAEIAELVQQLATPPWTVSHGDYRLDNILYRADGSLVVVDFQLVCRARPGWDVAYFITTALTPDLRSEQESMLRRYHDALVAAGVTDYSWSALLSDVESTKAVLAHRLVCGIDTLDTDMAGEAKSLTEILVKRVTGWID